MKASLSVLLLLFLAGAGQTPSLDKAVASIPNRDPAHVSPSCDDAEFLRRLSLDLLGYPPNGEQAAAFLSDPSPEKRPKKIDELLAMPRFADYWARRYAEVFFGNYHEPAFDVSPGLKRETRRRLLTQFIAWFRDQIHADRPWPETVTEMITARGNTATVPQLGYKLSFYGLERQEQTFADRIPSHLLGINFVCSRCHDHPFDRWLVLDYHGIAAFNTRQRAKATVVADREEVEVDYAEAGEWTFQGVVPKPIVAFPGYLQTPAPRAGDRIQSLAALMASDPEEHLQHALSNRVWSWLIGRGVVDPVDDLSNRNRPVSKALMEALIRVTDDGKGSLKALVRAICTTEAYQRTSASSGKCDRRHFCRAEILPLTGEQLINSVQVALRGVPGLDLEEAQELTAALTMRPQVGCEVRPLPCGTLHALMFRNSERLWGWIRESPILRDLRKGTPSDGETVERLFLAVLSRTPSPTERDRFAGFLRDRGNNGLCDACWILLNTAEFMTRH